MKLSLTYALVGCGASLLTGGFLGYIYGAYVYSKAEYVFKAAQNLELNLRNKLKPLL